MKSQLYMWNQLREKYKKEIKQLLDTYENRIAVVFKDIEGEANKVRDEYYENPSDFYGDPADIDCSAIAYDAEMIGLEHYEMLDLMKYNTRAMWISTMYQFWEQQVRGFLYNEIRHYYKIDTKDFCTNGMKEIKEWFKEHNTNLEELKSWQKIEELSLLNNVIKHGDGKSAENLRKVRDDLFMSGDIDKLELYGSSLCERALNITDEMVNEYAEVLMQFWNELPENMYSDELKK
ncbi:MAG TPA: hypothetical protein DCP90_07845 [Clostridiales bacterium]|nr:MAG: hypothetical protein A2Y22_06040 [Clostridiales bacterium GWD2_32_59]HAN10511.1 hypothetical protein [Clostridiales bacterium]